MNNKKTITPWAYALPIVVGAGLAYSLANHVVAVRILNKTEVERWS